MTAPETGAERVVLGCMMLDRSVIPTVVERLGAADFYDPRHATVFSAIVKNFDAGEPTEPVAVLSRLADTGDVRRVGGAPALQEMCQAVPSPATVGHYVAIVAGQAHIRRIGEAATRLQVESRIGSPERINDALASLCDLAQPAATRKQALEFLSVKELRDKVVAAGPRKWLLRGLWPDGDYGVFAGDMKAQKSWTVTDTVVSVASGTPWLGRVPVDRSGPVVMFVGEGGEADALRRIDAVCAGRGICADDLPIVICTRAPHLSDRVHLGLMADQLDRTRPVLTSIDPFYLSAGGANGGDLYGMGQLLERPQHTCQEIGSALILTTHQNRREGRGASRITGAGPAEWGRVLMSATVISRHLDTLTTETAVITELDVIGGSIPGGRLRVVRRIVADDPSDLASPLRYRVECEVTDGEGDDPAGLSPAATKVLAVLADAVRPLSNRDIGDAVKARFGYGLTRPTISKGCAELVAQGSADELDDVGSNNAKLWMATAHA